MSINENHVLKLGQAQTLLNGFATKADARFRKTADAIAKTDLATALANEIDAKLDAADLYTYTLKKETTAQSGYLATYQLYSIDSEDTETAVGAAINIPKDFLVKSATLETCSTADVPVTGYEVGDKYIDFTVNSKDDDATAAHFYINVKDLVDDYSAGNGLSLTNGVFSVAIDSSNANGLSVGANGLALAAVVASSSGSGGSAGAMTPAQAEKLAGLENYTHPAYTATTGAETANMTPAFGGSVTVSQVTSDATGHVTGQTSRTLTIPSATAVASTSGAGGSAGLMSAADKEKLDGFEYATSAEVTEVINSIWAD